MATTKVSSQIAGNFPLSRQQRRTRLHSAASSEFCVQSAVLVEGEVRFEELQERIRILVREEPAIRTVFQAAESSDTEQTILDFLEPTWAAAELTSCGPEELASLFASQRTPHFDLQHGPI